MDECHRLPHRQLAADMFVHRAIDHDLTPVDAQGYPAQGLGAAKVLTILSKNKPLCSGIRPLPAQYGPLQDYR